LRVSLLIPVIVSVLIIGTLGLTHVFGISNESVSIPQDEDIPSESPYTPRITPKPIPIGTSSVKIAPETSTPGCEERYQCFLPFSISVEKGITVTWTNDDSEPHTVTNGMNPIDPNAGMMFDSGLLMNHDLFSVTFDTEGEYPYFCLIHPWMIGLVVVESEITPHVPDWISNNAKWWAEGKIDDYTFVQGIEWLINEGAMSTVEIASYEDRVDFRDIPAWIKNNAGWWADGFLSDNDFISGIKYLVEHGIIIVDVSVEPTKLLQNCSGSAACISGYVTNIIDGDTIDVDGNSIRFSLASTPELNEFGGFDAKHFLEQICPVGSQALVDEDDGQTEGSYDRMIAVIYCNGVNLNEAVLEEGYALLSTSFCSQSEFSDEAWAKKFGC